MTAAFGGKAFAGARPVPATVQARVSATLAAGPAPALPSTLPLGAPLSDIAKGWDGTLCGIDSNGVPFQYDALSKAWSVLGNGFDAVCLWRDGGYFVTRGPLISVLSGDPVPMTTLWPALPDSFAQRIDGAVNISGTIYLFRNGRYLPINQQTKEVGKPVAVTTLTGWPTTSAAWSSGAVRAVGGHQMVVNQSQVLLWVGDEYVRVDMSTKAVISGPHPLSYFAGGQLLAGLQQGFSTMLWNETNYYVIAFNGPTAWTSANRNGTAYQIYAHGYCDSWVPVLRHAPSGTAGNRWAATAGAIYPAWYDGADWQAGPMTPNGNAVSVTVAQDGAVFALDAENLLHLNTTSNTWQILAKPTGLAQVVAADAGDVWVRSNAGQVSKWNSSTFAAVNLGRLATDIAAGTDGTLWHTSSTGPGSVYRYLSGGSDPSAGLDPGVPAGSTLAKVAATGFGHAYVLTSTGALYDYNTPYVFKSSEAYYTGYDPARINQSMSLGGPSLFVSCLPAGVPAASAVVCAVDVQTGAQLWGTYLPADVAGSAGRSGRNIYDDRLGLVYVVAALSVFALDARTGKRVWRFDTFQQLKWVEGQLGGVTLDQGILYVGYEVDGHLLAIDTDDALARAGQKQDPVALWATKTWLQASSDTAVGAPVVIDSTVYAQVSVGPAALEVVALDTGSGAVRWTRPFTPTTPLRDVPWDMVVGNTTPSGATQSRQALFVNAATVIYAIDPTVGSILGSFTPPRPTGAPAPILTSGMALRHDRLYVGDAGGRLYEIDALSMKLISSTSDPAQPGWTGVQSRPVIIAGQDPAAGLVVGFTRGDDHFYLFDPADGHVSSVQTDQTNPGLLGWDEAHGVLYAMAWAKAGSLASQLGQLFAIRPDTYIQDERSFVVESELLQDFGSDEEAGGDGVTRYQTHVSIVDSAKAPRGGQAIKVWADEPDTALIIDGTPFTIGPDSPATLSTDASGSFVIVSDATDLAAVTLRIWSAFMDTHERITVIPDAEFHRRLAAVSATGGTDPQQIDLVSAKSYDGARLFTDAGDAGQAATAIAQLTSTVGMGSGVGTTVLRSSLGDAAERYITYPNLPGLAYTPVDVPANLDVTAGNTVSFSLSSNGHTTLTPAQAADLLDSLTGDDTVLLGSGLSTLRNAWHEIRTTAAKVEKVVISAAKDVIAGIQYVVNGVTKVVKAVVTDIKDAAAAIGSFFVQLGKDIVKVVQALGKLLNLEAVATNAKNLRSQLDTAFSQLPGVLSTGKAQLDGWLANAEKQIAASFDILYSQMGLPPNGGGPVSGFNGMGSTASTAYNTGNDPDGPSQSVECGWSTQALRNNIGQATGPTGLQGSDDALSQIGGVFSTFTTTLTTDPTLKAAYGSVGQAFASTFKFNSFDQFVSNALRDLLEILEAIAITGVAVMRALMDALMANVQLLSDALQNVAEIRIPILSALWRRLTGKELTLLDLVCFVLAFPVTIMAATLDRFAPKQASVAASSATASGTRLAANSASTATNLLSLAGGLGMISAGAVTALMDSLAVVNADAVAAGKSQRAPGKMLVAAGIGLLAFSTLSLLYTAIAKDDDFSAAALSTTMVGLIIQRLPADAKSRPFVNLLTMLIAGLNIAVYAQKAQVRHDPAATITREVFTQVPLFAGPVKSLGAPVGLISPATDLLFRGAAGVMQITQTALAWYGEVTEPEPTTSTTPPTTSARPPVTTTPTTTAGGRPSPTTTRVHVPPPPITVAGSKPSLANTGVEVPVALRSALGTLATGAALLVLARNRTQGQHTNAVSPTEHTPDGGSGRAGKNGWAARTGAQGTADAADDDAQNQDADL